MDFSHFKLFKNSVRRIEIEVKLHNNFIYLNDESDSWNYFIVG